MTNQGVQRGTERLLPPTERTPGTTPEIETPIPPPPGQILTEITPHTETPGQETEITPLTGDRNIPLHPGIQVNTGISPPPLDTDLTGKRGIPHPIIDLAHPAGKIPTDRK